MKFTMRSAGAWVAAGCVAGMLSVSAAPAAKTVSITVEGGTEAWMTTAATQAAQSAFEKLGYQVADTGATADTSVTVTISQAYSHHATSPLFFIGGFLDLWNYDNAHATVTTVVREGSREVARQTASATRRDFPLFAWAQPAKHQRVAALKAAVGASLKEYLAGLPAQNKQAAMPN